MTAYTATGLLGNSRYHAAAWNVLAAVLGVAAFSVYTAQDVRICYTRATKYPAWSFNLEAPLPSATGVVIFVEFLAWVCTAISLLCSLSLAGSFVKGRSGGGSSFGFGSLGASVAVEPGVPPDSGAALVPPRIPLRLLLASALSAFAVMVLATYVLTFTEPLCAFVVTLFRATSVASAELYLNVTGLGNVSGFPAHPPQGGLLPGWNLVTNTTADVSSKAAALAQSVSLIVSALSASIIAGAVLAMLIVYAALAYGLFVQYHMKPEHALLPAFGTLAPQTNQDVEDADGDTASIDGEASGSTNEPPSPAGAGDSTPGTSLPSHAAQLKSGRDIALRKFHTALRYFPPSMLREGLTEDWRYRLVAFDYVHATNYVPFAVMNAVAVFGVLWVVLAAVSFLATYGPTRDGFFATLVALAVVQALNYVYLERVMRRYASGTSGIRHARVFILADWVYCFTIGFVVGLSSALVRLAGLFVVSLVLALMPHRPLYGRPFQLWDTGFAMHGALLKVSYAQGRAPPL